MSDHYKNDSGVETIDTIFAHGWGVDFCKGNILKYLSRAGRKAGTPAIDDYKKAAQYIEFLINFEERGAPRNQGHACMDCGRENSSDVGALCFHCRMRDSAELGCVGGKGGWHEPEFDR